MKILLIDDKTYIRIILAKIDSLFAISFIETYLYLKNIKILILVFLLCFQTISFSQNKVIDSLKLELLNHKTKDTTHINLLYSLALSSFQSDLKLTLSTLEDVVKLSDSLNYIKGKAKSSYLYGILENRKSKHVTHFKNVLC